MGSIDEQIKRGWYVCALNTYPFGEADGLYPFSCFHNTMFQASPQIFCNFLLSFGGQSTAIHAFRPCLDLHGLCVVHHGLVADWVFTVCCIDWRCLHISLRFHLALVWFGLSGLCFCSRHQMHFTDACNKINKRSIIVFPTEQIVLHCHYPVGHSGCSEGKKPHMMSLRWFVIH